MVRQLNGRPPTAREFTYRCATVVISRVLPLLLGCGRGPLDVGPEYYFYHAVVYLPDRDCRDGGTLIAVDSRYWPDPDTSFSDFDPSVVPFHDGRCAWTGEYVFEDPRVYEDPTVCTTDACFATCRGYEQTKEYCE